MNSSMLAHDYKPPFEVPGLMLRVKELEEQHVAFRDSLICAFNQLLDLKDISTGVHSTRLAEWAIRVARKLNIPEEHLYQVEVAALLHDIGKIGVPDAILKKNGPLTTEVRVLINRHPEYSWSILRLFPGLEQASLYALHHHENVDGTGYPAGLATIFRSFPELFPSSMRMTPWSRIVVTTRGSRMPRPSAAWCRAATCNLIPR
jgi:HD-GYP domain-containing protein (c-di-GMP phosphodiesterase class II)